MKGCFSALYTLLVLPHLSFLFLPCALYSFLIAHFLLLFEQRFRFSRRVNAAFHILSTRSCPTFCLLSNHHAVSSPSLHLTLHSSNLFPNFGSFVQGHLPASRNLHPLTPVASRCQFHTVPCPDSWYILCFPSVAYLLFKHSCRLQVSGRAFRKKMICSVPHRFALHSSLFQ